MSYLRVLFIASFLLGAASAQAASAPETVYYTELAALHRTAFVLDYILEPENFVDVCYKVQGEKLPALSGEQKAEIISRIDPLTKPLQKTLQEQEKEASLELINNLYLALKENQYIDYKRFFEVYQDKAAKSKELIKQDLLPKEEVFLAFLKLSKLPGEEYCQNKLQSDNLEELKAHWPENTEGLREELDSMLAGKTFPALYQDSYRRLLNE